MPSRQESSYCRKGESIEMAQKGIFGEKSQDSAKATENNGHVEDESTQVNEAEPGTDRQKSRTPENPVSRSVVREEEQTPDLFPQDIKSKITMLLVVIDQIRLRFQASKRIDS